MPFGSPRIHLRLIDSTNTRARELAAAGSPDGTLVTATEQTAGRGRQGRSWSAPAGSALLCSVVVRRPEALLSLRAGVAVAETVDRVVEGASAGSSVGASAGPPAAIKWPNDVLLHGRKVAGVLVEGRPSEDWAVVGVGLNVAVSVVELPSELRDSAGTLGLRAACVEPVLAELLARIEHWRSATAGEVLEELRVRDALRGRELRWEAGSGIGAGIDADGRLLVDTENGPLALDAGEVHLST